MPPAVYLGVGHGKRASGVYDPGAVNPVDGAVEHELAHAVAEAAGAGLARSKIAITLERDAGTEHDPDYLGSIKRVNEGDYDCALEVHFDWHRGREGVSPLYTSPEGGRLGIAITAAFQDRDLPLFRTVKRDDLAFLSRTNVPAVIVEVDRVQRLAPADLRKRGEAIAAGVCAFLGLPYVPLSDPPTHGWALVVGPPPLLHGVYGTLDAAVSALRRYLVEHGSPGHFGRLKRL